MTHTLDTKFRPRLQREQVARGLALLATLMLFALLATQPAFAALPGQLSVPQGANVSQGDYISLWQFVIKKGVAVAALIIGAGVFLYFAAGFVTKFVEYRKGKAEVGDLKEYGIVGTAVTVIVVALLTVAVSVID
jgi:integrating conjugative element membrane protein (TIGR03745 family)